LAVPDTLILASREAKRRDPSDWMKLVRGTAGGNRNETATRIIGKALWALWIEFDGQPELVPVLWDFACSWNKSNDPPLAERELETIMKSVTRKQYARAGTN
jgi:hypothetical protein